MVSASFCTTYVSLSSPPHSSFILFYSLSLSLPPPLSLNSSLSQHWLYIASHSRAQVKPIIVCIISFPGRRSDWFSLSQASAPSLLSYNWGRGAGSHRVQDCPRPTPVGIWVERGSPSREWAKHFHQEGFATSWLPHLKTIHIHMIILRTQQPIQTSGLETMTLNPGFLIFIQSVSYVLLNEWDMKITLFPLRGHMQSWSLLQGKPVLAESAVLKTP